MNTDPIHALMSVYRDGLLEDTLPFWINHAVDKEHGGFLTALDRDGWVLDTDKSMWQQARFTWLLATLYATVEARSEWLDLARHGIEFMRRHGFDEDGRMFFLVTQNGRPLRKRRYLFTEAFGVMAFAAWARASGDESAAAEARGLFERYAGHASDPGLVESKWNLDTRPMRTIGYPMTTLTLAQTLRETLGGSEYDTWIDRSIDEIRRYFLKSDLEAVMETVGPNGELLDHFDGRTLNPGHAIEAAWFVLHEARHRGKDPDLIRMGANMIDWMWARGWDEEYGGLLYFCDLKGLPVQEYWHDMKFWWPHCEAIIGTLLAYALTGEKRFAERHEQVHDWAHSHFHDSKHGEWFGYLHRTGRLSVSIKGNHWKGPFHLPRMQLYCWQLLEEEAARSSS
jgi:N-acylglucosamine 2-epimerase